MFYIVLPIHWKMAGLTSLAEVGIVLSINRFIRLPLHPFISLIYKKISFRNSIMFATILAGTTTFLYGVVDQFSGWLIIRSIWGIAWSFFKLGAFFLIITMATDKNYGTLMSTYNGLYRMGSLFGMLLGGILADAIGVKSISMIFGLVAFITIPFIFTDLPKTIEIDQKKEERISFSFLPLNKKPSFLLIYSTAFFSVMALEAMVGSLFKPSNRNTSSFQFMHG